ncbi:MAG TPA: DUF4328 domain-containing protein [Croceibacterium sp.]|nr:DUF4328 domain-containing protein [Croceibacterium sp.]
MTEDNAAKLAARTRMVVIALWSVIALELATILGQLAEAAGMVDLDEGMDGLTMIVAFSYMAYAVAMLICVLLVCLWLHRAHANLHEAGVGGLEYTPGWAVGWYFIPFANLVKPHGAMRELWHASHGETGDFRAPAPSLINYWWAAWIAGNIVSNVSAQMAVRDPSLVAAASLIGAVGSALSVAAALLLLQLVQRISAAQRDGRAAANVFA